MKKILLYSYAKINLYLDVISKRKNGFHNINTIMQNISLYDEIEIKIKDANKKNIKINFSGYKILCDSENTVYKTVNFFFEKLQKYYSTTINIKKNIPVGSGLGGGASNAAAVLSGLNFLLNKPFNFSTLNNLAKRIGSDVPFFLKGGTCFCEGRGEKVKKMSDLENLYVVIIKSNFSISTKTAYEKLSLKEKVNKKNLNKMLLAIKKQDFRKIYSNLFNIFEIQTEREYPQIKKIKEKLINLGAKAALLSGTGSCVFGIFDKKPQLKEINFKDAEVYLSKFINRGFDFDKKALKY